MNRYLAAWGVLVAAGGVVMYLLLQALRGETFFMAAYYIPPAQEVAAGVVAAGAIMLVVSAFSERPRYSVLGNETAARYFARVALVNALAAAVFASAMLVPPLELPILVTEWPGIYIVVAYGSFVGVGVMGMLGWAVVYQMLPNFFLRSLLDRRSVILQLVLCEVGIFVVSTILFLAGFRGASLVHDGLVGSVFVGASMEFADIPVAVSIFVIIVSVFLGAVNILRAKSVPQP
jgi:hypothetical protein